MAKVLKIGTGAPDLKAEDLAISEVVGLQTELNLKADSSSLATVATSGDYNDLLNAPDLSAFDEVEQHANLAAFPATGSVARVYVARNTGYLYRWDGSQYVQLTDQTAIWGQVSGTLSNQTDLQIALDAIPQNIDGGFANSTYTVAQNLDGGTASG